MIHPVVDLGIPETVGGLINVQTLRRIYAFDQAQRSGFYRGKLDHIDIDQVTKTEEWVKIPILDQGQLEGMDQQTFQDVFCLAPDNKITEFWQAGGLADAPLFYPRTSRDVAYAAVGFKRAMVLAGFTQDDVAQMSMPLGSDPMGHMMARSGSEMGVGMIWAGSTGASDISGQLDLLRRLRPTAWIGSVSDGIALGEFAQAQGFDLAAASVNKILCTGEPLPDTKRNKLTALWGAEVRDCFGMSEVMMTGCEDAACYGFRFWSDFCFPEVLDPQTFELLDEGVPGVLVVTSLVTNNATPFLRYNTGQIVTMRSMKQLTSPFDIFPLVQPTELPKI